MGVVSGSTIRRVGWSGTILKQQQSGMVPYEFSPGLLPQFLLGVLPTGNDFETTVAWFRVIFGGTVVTISAGGIV